MKFLIGEGGMSYLERLTYRGVIGLFYESTLEGLLAYIIFGLFCILAIIGLLTILKFIFFGRPKKEDPGKKWLRTGKFN